MRLRKSLRLLLTLSLLTGLAQATVLHASTVSFGMNPLLMQASGPVFSTNPASLDVGPVAVGVHTPVFTVAPPFAIPLQVINSGSAPLTANFSFSSTEFGFDSATNLSNPVTIQAGSSVTGGIVFQPAAAGTRTAQFISNDNAPGSPHMVQLTGTGITVPNNDFGVFLDPAVSAPVALKAGQTTSFKMWVLAGPGLNASISVVGILSCGGGPKGTTCSFSPPAVSGGFNQSSTRSNFTVSVTVPAGAASMPPSHPIFWALAWLAILVLAVRRRNFGRMAFASIVLAVSFATSCGGGNSPPLTITVAADGLGVTHTATVPVIVQ